LQRKEINAGWWLLLLLLLLLLQRRDDLLHGRSVGWRVRAELQPGLLLLLPSLFSRVVVYFMHELLRSRPVSRGKTAEKPQL
jgi:hypothetical protein